jgi:hypothetical protein
MQARVRIANRDKGMVALEDKSDKYIIIEVPHWGFELDDLVSGELDSVGSKILRNDTKEELIHVYIKEINATLERAQQLLSS